MVINEIFKEHWNRADEIEISIDQLKDELRGGMDEIVLYGAGSAGIALLYYLRNIGLSPKWFADGDPNKWNTVCEGMPVIDYRDITKRAGENALVIITINTDGQKYCKSFDENLRKGGHTKVYRNLRDAGCKNIIDYTYFRRCWKMFQGDNYNLPSCSDVYLMERNEEELCKAYLLLEDDKSREIFEKLVRFRMLDDSVQVPTEAQDKQYFEYEFFDKRDDEIFVDCGAYNGITLDTFLKENKYCFKKYYGMEPDKGNFRKLKDYIMKLPCEIQAKIMITEKAAYSREEKLKLYSLNSPGSFIADIGMQEIDTVRIDDLVDEEGVTYIKMNIEGTELQALKGAEQTIKRYSPRLAIAGYHKTRDLWEVPKTIYNIDSTYRFYLRSYMNNLSFVYYGIRS